MFKSLNNEEVQLVAESIALNYEEEEQNEILSTFDKGLRTLIIIKVKTIKSSRKFKKLK